jgi:hypothetical protein
MKSLNEIRKGLAESTAFQDPPTVLVLRRKAIRLFPNGQRVATYRNDNFEIEVAIPYDPQTLGKRKIATLGTAVAEEVANEDDFIIEDTADNMFGSYLKHSAPFSGKPTHHIESAITKKFGEKACQHFKAAASCYSKGEMDAANHHYTKFKSAASGVAEEVIAEATIHTLHVISKSKAPSAVRFKNGANAMVHHGTAAQVMKLHSMMKAANKRRIEALVNSSPDGLKKVVDFATTHMR